MTDLSRCAHCRGEIYQATTGWRHKYGGSRWCYQQVRFPAEPPEAVKPRARTTDPDTSHEAAKSVDDLTAKQMAVYDVMLRIGPATDERIRQAYEIRHKQGFSDLYPKQSESGLRTRRSELVKAGFVFDTGGRESMSTGRMAILWKAKQPADSELSFTQGGSDVG